MRQVNWKKLVGQKRIKDVLGAAIASNNLAHAYLFCGEPGFGTFAAALEMALSLLCESSDTVPCYSCSSCERVLRYEHTDFHVVMPLYLRKEHKSRSGGDTISEEGWRYIYRTVTEAIDQPYRESVFEGIPTVPVEWIREIIDSILRGTTLANHNVVVFCRAEMLNKESANSLLKILEEPPSNTVMILTSSNLHAILPTIVSRCQIVRFGNLKNEEICSFLQQWQAAKDLSSDKLQTIIDFSMGSLSKALYYLENPPQEDMQRAGHIWKLISGKDWDGATRFIDEVSNDNNYGALENLFYSSMLYIRQELFGELRSSYFLAHNPNNRVEIYEKLLRCCQKTLSAIRSRGIIALILVNFFIDAMEISHGKKQ